MVPNDHYTRTNGTENADNNNGAVVVVENNAERESPNGSGPKPELEISKVKLNPLAKEFFPSSYRGNWTVVNSFNQHMGNDGFLRRRNTQVRRFNGNSNRAQREDCIRRTVYVNDVDHNVSEDMLASVFHSKCGYVVDCRICGDPRSPLRFAFVEFKDERGAKEALKLCGTVVGLFSIKVSPSKTAILPVNPVFLPKSESERAMVARTVYCTNIDKLVTYVDIKFFFETFCGEVTRLRLLGDYMHSTCIAFVEFASIDSAVTALSCSGALLGYLPIRVNPSKTPVRARYPRHDRV